MKEKMYYEGLEKKMLAIFLVLVILPLTVFAIVSLHYTKELGESIVDASRTAGIIAVNDAEVMSISAVNESKNALTNQTEFYLQRLVIKEADKNNLFFENIERESENIASYAKGVYRGYTYASCRARDCHSNLVMTSIPIKNETMNFFIENKPKNIQYLINYYLYHPYSTINKTEFSLIYDALKPPVKRSIDQSIIMAPFFKSVADKNSYVDWIYMGFSNGVTVLYPYDENPAVYDPRV
ncbi:MAG: hypothetical protein ACE5J3_06330, partial [Methanosarcinales archaeon]